VNVVFTRLDKEITPLDLPLAVPIPRFPSPRPTFAPAAILAGAIVRKKELSMRLKDKIKQAGAAGYILLWLLGIPLPILLLIFLLRGCT